ncbi:family 16 glycosylhydrolase [Saccharicrinis aurantiacus]|uniref:family 16 glycosylhydrolase n=1 Tax=Saccharicrinis aurantiacus TaxID=1849719 RepID=UPI00094F50C6|nr:family 16 glycosylhydrolase [Saccharicrinis aurantiacus]
MMTKLKTLSTLVLMCSVAICFAQKTPTFKRGEDPKPKDKKWVLIEEMSDEFNGDEIDEKKWQISGQGWIGRPPGIFLAENIKLKDGLLHAETCLLKDSVVKNNKTYTHGGAYVGSRTGTTYGYFEARMKANKTFMSSTFWLINSARGKKGCDKRTTELDIQECVGTITGKGKWLQGFNERMNANNHSRNIPEGCDYKKGTAPVKGNLKNGLVTDDFHVYAVWWKSKSEILFFLDGELLGTTAPPADFDLEMHLRMVVETYDWNPVPEGGGMNFNLQDRTTYYDWVRSWKLEDK